MQRNMERLSILWLLSEQVEKAVEIFSRRHPKVKFAGYRNGYCFEKAKWMLRLSISPN